MAWKNIENPKKQWTDEVPAEDDFGYPIKDEFIDGQTKYGQWATMTPESFKVHGVGLGFGKGQHYKKTEDVKSEVEQFNKKHSFRHNRLHPSNLPPSVKEQEPKERPTREDKLD